MSVYDYIAYKDGSLFTIWGPCTGDGTQEEQCDCPQSQHADKLEAEGKDFNEEYDKAMKADSAQ